MIFKLRYRRIHEGVYILQVSVSTETCHEREKDMSKDEGDVLETCQGESPIGNDRESVKPGPIGVHDTGTG